MFYYNPIDLYGSVGINKTNDSYECKICYCSYFFGIDFTFERVVFDVYQIFNGVANFSVKKDIFES